VADHSIATQSCQREHLPPALCADADAAVGIFGSTVLLMAFGGMFVNLL
jgi:hypothetical protein